MFEQVRKSSPVTGFDAKPNRVVDGNCHDRRSRIARQDNLQPIRQRVIRNWNFKAPLLSRRGRQRDAQRQANRNGRAPDQQSLHGLPLSRSSLLAQAYGATTPLR